MTVSPHRWITKIDFSIKCQIGATNNSDQNVKEVSKAANIDNIATQF